MASQLHYRKKYVAVPGKYFATQRKATYDLGIKG